MPRCRAVAGREPGSQAGRNHVPRMAPWGCRGEVGAPKNSGRALHPWAPAQPAAAQPLLPAFAHWAH